MSIRQDNTPMVLLFVKSTAGDVSICQDDSPMVRLFVKVIHQWCGFSSSPLTNGVTALNGADDVTILCQVDLPMVRLFFVKSSHRLTNGEAICQSDLQMN